MNNFKIKKALGKYIIVEPVDKSTVLKTEETATVFRVLSIPETKEVKSTYKILDGNEMITETNFLHTEQNFEVNNLIIVSPNSVEKTMMGNQEILYCRDTDAIAVVTEE